MIFFMELNKIQQQINKSLKFKHLLNFVLDLKKYILLTIKYVIEIKSALFIQCIKHTENGILNKFNFSI